MKAEAMYDCLKNELAEQSPEKTEDKELVVEPRSSFFQIFHDKSLTKFRKNFVLDYICYLFGLTYNEATYMLYSALNEGEILCKVFDYISNSLDVSIDNYLLFKSKNSKKST